MALYLAIVAPKMFYFSTLVILTQIMIKLISTIQPLIEKIFSPVTLYFRGIGQKFGRYSLLFGRLSFTAVNDFIRWRTLSPITILLIQSIVVHSLELFFYWVGSKLIAQQRIEKS